MCCALSHVFTQRERNVMGEFSAHRAELLARTDLSPALRRQELVSITDAWLTHLCSKAQIDALNVSLVAVGGFGRRELAPGSDLDLLLLADNSVSPEQLAQITDQVWYPIWDEGIRLDHSVRNVSQAMKVASQDLKAVLGLLDARTIVGPDELRSELSHHVLTDWRSRASERLPELRDFVVDRTQRFGELAHLLEPDVKESFGGLRDLTVLRAIAASWLTDVDHAALVGPNELLLDVRDALHTVTGRSADRLLLQEQQTVAEYLGFNSGDDLLRRVLQAGRTIAYVSDLTWHRVRPQKPTARRSFLSRRGSSRDVTDRMPLAEGVVVAHGEAVLSQDAQPAQDPTLILRAAAAAAQHGLRLSPHTVERLATQSGALPEPWPRAARESLVSLLGAGHHALPVWEALDQFDVWSRLIPEWSVVRSAAQHNAVHIYTVDRHLVETAIQASSMLRRVSRPDLLLVGSLLHDIGKARGGDHSEVGAQLVSDIAPRLGFDSDETDILVKLVRHHLLLPEIAMRRDPQDPATIQLVTDAVQTSSFLDLLLALTESDARATGPTVSTEWRMGLISELARNVQTSLSGENIPPAPLLPEKLSQGTGIQVVIDDQSTLPTITVAAPDTVGLLALTAGVLALHRLNVRTATTQTFGDRAVSVWGVTPQFGEMPSVPRLELALRLAYEGTSNIQEKLDRRLVESFGDNFTPASPTVTVDDSASAHSTVIEVRAHDMPGLLYRVARAISDCDVDIVGARVATLGSEVVDVFYVRPLREQSISRDVAEAIRTALSGAIPHHS